MKKIFVTALSFVLVISITAQRRETAQSFDTTKKTVVITSAYKPSLKPAAKINFTAPSPFIDTIKPILKYEIPSQNLFFSYQPTVLKPLALSSENNIQWVNNNYIKLGFGNYSTIYGDAGVSFGDGVNSFINLNGKHLSQKGGLPFQQYNKSGLNLNGIFSSDGNTEWRGGLGFETSSQYYYGFQPDSLVFQKDSIKQRYSNISATIGLMNKQANEYGISYSPSLSFNLFFDNRKASETNILLNAPMTKVFDENLSLNVGLVADITSLKTMNGDKVKNNLFYMTPAFVIKRSSFSLNVGVTPSWDNANFHALPNITAVVKIKDESFVLQGGWIGYYQKNNYQSLAGINPFISQPSFLFNTRIMETYAGLKGSGGSYLSYNAKVGIRSFRSAALFINDSLDGKTFLITPEEKMNSLMIHGELGYSVQEKFSLLAGITVNNYSNLKSNDKAWGMLPLEITGALRWQVLEELQFKADAFFWNGASYFKKGFGADRQKGAYDLNVGAEYTLTPKLHAWLQVNNILNNKYQRWNQYQVLGLNMAGGIVYSFAQ